MKRTWWTAVVAAVVAVVGTIAVGCSGSVDVVQDPSCPAKLPTGGDACAAPATTCAYQDGPCSLTFRCAAADQPWQVEDTACMPAAVDCWQASEGDICAVPGDGCGEGEPCGGGFFNQCGDDHRWHTNSTGGDGCCPTDACPVSLPKEGDPCDACFGPPSCSYPDMCGGSASATCDPSGTWHLSISDCPPPPADGCAIHGTEAECGTDPACRWLVPGCGDPALPQAGCFASTDCTADSCGPGLTCQKVVFDPCYMKGCNACSADAAVCLP